MSVNFTLDDVVAKVREVAAERPTYVYNNEGMSEYTSSCFYRHGENRDRPGCIVGQALDRLGYVVPTVMEGSHATSVLHEIFGVPSDSEIEAKVRWVRNVQRAQDAGRSWAQAVKRADSCVHLPVNA
jgi:hypothetical protein